MFQDYQKQDPNFNVENVKMRVAHIKELRPGQLYKLVLANIQIRIISVLVKVFIPSHRKR